LSASQKLVYRHASFVVVLSTVKNSSSEHLFCKKILVYKILLIFVANFFSGGQPQTPSWGEDPTIFCCP